MFSCEFCEISKNTFSYRIPPVAACKNTVLLTHSGQDLIFSQLFLISTISMPLTKRHLWHMHVLIFSLFTDILHHKLVAIINGHELNIFLKIRKRNTFQLMSFIQNSFSYAARYLLRYLIYYLVLSLLSMTSSSC